MPLKEPTYYVIILIPYVIGCEELIYLINLASDILPIGKLLAIENARNIKLKSHS